MKELKVYPIGKIAREENEIMIVLGPKYAEGIKGLEGYSHIQVLWWADRCDNTVDREVLTETKPYRKGPDEIGVFATRSPGRPNPIAISNVGIEYINEDAGTIGLSYIDAFPETAVLDIKPYIPSIDRIEHPAVPQWCSHWPDSYEKSADFDWESEFNF